MPIHIVKKAKKREAVITILGIQGGKVENGAPVIFNFDHQAVYWFENESERKKYFNTLPLLMDRYDKNLNFDPQYRIEDEKNFDEIFAVFNRAIEPYDRVVIDVSHGFRHLPLLMLVDLIIKNFQNPEKIEAILFAKQIVAHTPNNIGEYEIIDLHHYVDLANISFILSTFDKNYTVAAHIEAQGYEPLIQALNDFSNDLMALNLNNLFINSSKQVIEELSKISNSSIKDQAEKLKLHIKKTFNYEGKKRYQSYLDLAEELFGKSYMLLSLSLLYESSRLFLKSYLKKKNPDIIEKVECSLLDRNGKIDLYALGDFVKRIVRTPYERHEAAKKILNESEYELLKKSIPHAFKKKIAFKNIPNLTSHKNPSRSYCPYPQ